MGLEFLESIEIIFIASALVVFLLYKLKIPSLVGFLVAGVIIGPHGLGVIKDTHSIEMLAEVGVILLLFTIGIEFSMDKLVRMRKAIVGGGGSQVLLSIILSSVVAYLATKNINKSIFFGFIVALSSTAIVLKMLSERGETDTPHGRMMVGILIFQDLCVVPLMLLTPALAGEGINIVDIGIKMGKAVLIIAAVLLAARRVVPGLLHQVVGTRSRELFITTIILLCLGIALLTSRFGLSLALGAFLAGLVISGSEYSHQATSDILPFKATFIGLFFVSIGMLMNIDYLAGNYLKILMAILLIFIIKIIAGLIAVLIAGSPLRTALHAGLGTAQVGEFSFVIATAGKAAGLITGDFYQLFLSASVATMMMTPFILQFAPSMSAWVASRHLLKKVDRLQRIPGEGKFPRTKSGHVIIVGFGLNGRNLARVLRKTEIPYVVLEMNSDTVREMKEKGEPIYYGDGTSKDILRKMGVETAKLLVVAISDPVSMRGIVALARNENPHLYIIARTRYMSEVDDLRALGANEVIPEEFETSIEIFSRVLHHYQVPGNVIAGYINRIREDNYSALRSVELPPMRLNERDEFLKNIETETYLIRESSNVNGYTIRELNLRAEAGVTIIAVQRGEEVYQNPSPDFILKSEDIILLIGKRKDINDAVEYLESDKFLIPHKHII